MLAAEGEVDVQATLAGAASLRGASLTKAASSLLGDSDEHPSRRARNGITTDRYNDQGGSNGWRQYHALGTDQTHTNRAGADKMRAVRTGALRRVEDDPLSNVCHEPALEAFERELDYLFLTLRRLRVPPADLEDVAQEVFLVLRAGWSKFDPNRPFRPYLFGIAFRVAAAYRRKWGRLIPVSALDSNELTPTPSDALESAQTDRMLWDALERMPLSRRAILVMHYIEELPVAEMARALSKSKFTLYSRLRTARRELRAALPKATR